LGLAGGLVLALGLAGGLVLALGLVARVRVVVVVAGAGHVGNGSQDISLHNERGQEVEGVDATGGVLVVTSEASGSRVTDLELS
jgi:hypothetical protein